MKRAVLLIAIAAASIGCEKKKAGDAPAPAPVAPAPTKPAGVPPPAPSQPMPVACAELHVAIAKDKIAHSRDTTVEVPSPQGAIDRAALSTSLAARAATCIGPVLVTASDEIGYQDIVTVLDVAAGQGFTDVGFGEQSVHNNPTAPLGKDELAKVPVVVVSKTEVRVGSGLIPLGAPDLERRVASELAGVKLTGASSSALIIQADIDTSAKTINAIVRGANATGFGNVLFAVQHR